MFLGKSVTSAGVRAREAVLELGEGEVGGEFAAAEPDRCARDGAAVGQRDRVAGDLSGVLFAVAEPDEHPGPLQPLEELDHVAAASGSGAHVPAQLLPVGQPGDRLALGGSLALDAGELLGLGPGRALGGGPARGAVLVSP
jgi:hypothetical protein